MAHLFVPFVLVLVHARVPLFPGCGTSLCSVCPVWQPSAYSWSSTCAVCFTLVVLQLSRLWYIFVLHLSGMAAFCLVLVFCLSGCTVCFTFCLYKDYRFWCFTCFVIIYFISWVTYACSPLCPFNSLYFHSLVCSFCQLRFRLPPHLSALPFLPSNIMSVIIATAFLSHPL